MNRKAMDLLAPLTGLAKSPKQGSGARGVHQVVRRIIGGLLIAVNTACAGNPAQDQHEFETGPTMLPGDNCRSCHGSPSTQYPEAPEWTVAGTVFDGPQSDVGAVGVRVLIRDRNGTTEELVTNSVGNFHTAVALQNPYVVTLEKDGVSVTMPGPPPSGGCNACHNKNPIGGAPGRLFLPADGTYESSAVCEDNDLVVGSTRYPCAPFACVSAAEASGAHCASTCTTDDDCPEGACEGDLCVAP